MMEITLEIPETVAKTLGYAPSEWASPPWWAAD
jgi:hypothetical protein